MENEEQSRAMTDDSETQTITIPRPPGEYPCLLCGVGAWTESKWELPFCIACRAKMNQPVDINIKDWSVEYV